LVLGKTFLRPDECCNNFYLALKLVGVFHFMNWHLNTAVYEVRTNALMIISGEVDFYQFFSLSLHVTSQ